jgi:hypothetical protein
MNTAQTGRSAYGMACRTGAIILATALLAALIAAAAQEYRYRSALAQYQRAQAATDLEIDLGRLEHMLELREALAEGDQQTVANKLKVLIITDAMLVNGTLGAAGGDSALSAASIREIDKNGRFGPAALEVGALEHSRRVNDYAVLYRRSERLAEWAQSFEDPDLRRLLSTAVQRLRAAYQSD